MRKIFLFAYRLKCKGITIYCYGSKKNQVLSFGYGKTETQTAVSGPVSVDSEYSGGCATGTCPF